jgi:diguanylate cyclase (GGDEF)-like protein/PAS domain S-box-containing protein
VSPFPSAFEQQHRFDLLVDAIQDHALYMLDVQGRVSTWNAGAQRTKGYTADEVLGHSFSQFFLPEDRADQLPERILQTAKTCGRFAGEGWRVRKDGSRFWASVVLTPIDDETGKLLGFAKFTRDLTEQRAQQAALEASERALREERDRLHVTLHALNEGVVATDTCGRITLMSSVAEELTGWTRREALGRDIEEVFHLVRPETGEIVHNPIRDALLHHQHTYLQDGFALRSRTGVIREVQESAAPIRSADGVMTGAVIVFQDITHLRRFQREIAFSAAHDALTGLPNRRQFEVGLEEALQRSANTGLVHTVCFLDLDRFKVVNDTAGHSAGDALLKTVASLLTQHVREADLVARLGGDEFGIILSGCTPDQGSGRLHKILESISGLPFVWEGRSFPISVSIGVAEVNSESDLATVMKQADVACYAAKHAGRNRISVYSPENSDVYDRHQQLQVASEIRDAISQGRLSLVAQKIVPTKGPDQPHYEVLLRMRDREGKLLLPGHFIPAAERYDLMADLDRWVITHVLLDCGEKLAARPDLRLSLNLSANSLNDPKFLQFFLGLVRRSSVRPSALTFEITETSLINNLIVAGAVIEKLRSIGCRVALDDFGIGMCSFSYLRSFRVDYVKIDGSFVRNIAESPVDMTIVRSINNIAHEVGARTIAEFVETAEVLRTVRDLNIDYAQGYAVGRPEPLEHILQAHTASVEISAS